MADLKISQLTSATLPLAGTEVLPIVQSSSTKKVATDDLTVKNVRSNATTGILQVAGPGTGTTRVMTTPDANFTSARTDAAQSFTGDQTLSTGNLIIGTSGKGIDFSATPGTGTSELLADYEEGTWTPTLTCTTPGDLSVTYAANGQQGYYTRVGRMVYLQYFVNASTFTHSTASGPIRITGLPFTSANNAGMQVSGPISEFDGVTKANYTSFGLYIAANSNVMVGEAAGSAQAYAFLNVADLPSGTSKLLAGTISYSV